MDERDYDEPDSDEEKKDAAVLSDESDDDFDLSKVKTEAVDDFNTSKVKDERPSNADVEQLEEIERKEDEELDQLQGDTDILAMIAKKVTASSNNVDVRNFYYDKEKHSWCCIKFDVPIKFKNIDMTNVLREAAKASIIWEVPKIKRAFAHKQNDVLVVTTDGINIGVSLHLNCVLFPELNNHLIFHRRCSSTIRFLILINSTPTISTLLLELTESKLPPESSSRKSRTCSKFTVSLSIHDTYR